MARDVITGMPESRLMATTTTTDVGAQPKA